MKLKSLLLLPAVALVSWSLRNIKLVETTQSNLPFSDLLHNSMDIETADLDSDGDPDIVLAMEFKPNILLINDGKGKFTNESKLRLPQVVHDSEDIALGDFDGDGDIDIVFVSEDDRVHEYYLNDGKGYFSDNSNHFTFNSTANAVDVADYDRDGDLDLILGNDGQDFFLLNDGKGAFSDATASRMPKDGNTTQDVQSADADGDGDLDLVMGNEDGNRLYLNDGKGFFTDATATRLPLANEETRKMRWADIDADGDQDIFVCNVNFRKDKDLSNRILVNNGKGFFKDETSQRLKAVNDMHTGDVAFADLDGDKDPDMVIANLFGGVTQVCINDGKGAFTEVTATVFSSGINGDAISAEITDLNGDGLPDLYLGFFRGGDRLFFSKK